jgi:glucosamine kinase
MILLADSGSTKTDWALINSKAETFFYQTNGLNPYHNDSIRIKEEINSNLLHKIDKHSVKEIHFYGSGCGVQDKKEIVSQVLVEIFNQSKININTDILGAARALLGNEKGIACILGTGANSCYFDGETIQQIVPSTGFIFGDEGSGSHIGKLLISHYLKNTLPGNIHKAFENRYKLKFADILDKVYRQQFPNRFLASFSPFILEHISEPFILDLLEHSFNDFINYYIKQYKDYDTLPITFTGSIAYHFKSQLEKAFYHHNLNITSITQSPIDNLIKFHSR